jgi:hypothetical protein
MRIAVAIALAASALHFTTVPTRAEAAPQIRGNTCFSDVGSDAGTAQKECERAGFTCTAPKVMRCFYDNGRQMYLCQCKDPPKNPKAYLRENERQRQSKPSEEIEYRETEPGAVEQPPSETEPQELNSLAHNC